MSTTPSNLPVTPPKPASNATSDPLVCFCRHVHEGTLLDAIREGCCSVEDLAVRTRAGTGCATCRFDLLDLIARTTTRTRCAAEGCAP
ncbi:MAG: (2Fe-2S)-binding protein [Planctomycetes bacterium]|nr:(2Fe-2S)-binding protein [Planctomycetota bacterium]